MGNDAVEERLDDPQVNQGRRRFLTATTAVVGAVGVGFVAVTTTRIVERTSDVRAWRLAAPMPARDGVRLRATVVA